MHSAVPGAAIPIWSTQHILRIAERKEFLFFKLGRSDIFPRAIKQRDKQIPPNQILTPAHSTTGEIILSQEREI
jgi:hypothetical protein